MDDPMIINEDKESDRFDMNETDSNQLNEDVSDKFDMNNNQLEEDDLITNNMDIETNDIKNAIKESTADENIIKIPLYSKGKIVDHALIDKIDEALISPYHWTRKFCGERKDGSIRYYAYTSYTNKDGISVNKMMHKMIMSDIKKIRL